MNVSLGARLGVRLSARRCHHCTDRKRRRWRCGWLLVVIVSDDSLVRIDVRDIVVRGTDVVRPAKAATPGPMLAPRARWRWADRPTPGPNLSHHVRQPAGYRAALRPYLADWQGRAEALVSPLQVVVRLRVRDPTH